ncbi:hypothetical protein AB4Z48_16200 [Cupriavidus sp. 2TAF22]|uniref:hypothetical protein n=1 Tax=unclassified Cupriavidus TaxID=2640874 RepID=UPI003F902930
MKIKRQAIDLDTILPPFPRSEQWLMEVADGKTTLAFDDWFVIKLASAEGEETGTATDVACGRTMTFHQGPVEFELTHGACYTATHPQKGVRHFKCILDGHYPMISFYRPGTALRFPWITMARVFVADELRSLKRAPVPAWPSQYT